LGKTPNANDPVRHLPRAQWDALKRRRQARRDCGQDSDEETNNSKEEEDANDPPAPEVPLKLQERDNAIAMFVRTLLFSRGAATALYDDQAVQSLETLRKINDDMIKEMCCAIRKPGDNIQGYGISELSMSRLKLFLFYAKHMWRTSRGIDKWTKMTWDNIKDLVHSLCIIPDYI
jgi:hypothetical protein